ncbi:MAG: hypothetical protein K2W82_09095 [Candidatus Obscuribacterales bacterium]|nr:hypothetical protein [Candidatus Obscuribacterales bacterium]
MITKPNMSLFYVVICLVLAPVLHCLQLNLIAATEKQRHPQEYGKILPSVETVRLLSLGFERAAADIYWLLFVQYYGDPDAGGSKSRYILAPRFLELVIKLDPHFIEPYWFASFILGSELKLKKECEQILDFGIRENPDSWTLPYIAGFNEYIYQKNVKKAAAYYRIGAACPNAPAWLAQQAKIMDSGVPAIVKTTQIWWQVYHTADSPMIKQKARAQLVTLFSQIYWSAPTQIIKDTAMMRLRSLDARPIPQSSSGGS